MTQEIGDPVAGYALRPADGWEAEQREGRILMAPPGGAALVMAIPHAASGHDELAPLFEQGWTEPGLELAPAGSPEKRDDGSVALELTGRADEEEARGSLMVLFGPHGGGLILIGVARTGDGDPPAPVSAVSGTVRFSEPDTAALLEGWNQTLKGKKLSYFYTYSSGPLGGGITERHELILHEDGRFEQEGSSWLRWARPAARPKRCGRPPGTGRSWQPPAKRSSSSGERERLSSTSWRREATGSPQRPPLLRDRP